MTSPERPELERVRNWSAGLAAALSAVAGEVGDLARRLAAGWPDHHGREWSERLLTLRTSLERDTDAAVRLGQAVDRARSGRSGRRRARGSAAPPPGARTTSAASGSRASTTRQDD